jgi:hypothetical protein
MVRKPKTLEETYMPYLCKLMAFRDSAPDYPILMVWKQDELLEITPDDIARWFKLLAYGTATPSPTELPTFCRSSNLEHASQEEHNSFHAQQAYVLGCRMKLWQPIQVCAGQRHWFYSAKVGVPKRDMKRAEYSNTMRILEAKYGNFEWQSKTPIMLKFQFHIIARTDDITNLETNDLRSHDTFGKFAL